MGAAIAKDQMQKQGELARKYNEELKVRRAEMAAKQKLLIEREVQRRSRHMQGSASSRSEDTWRGPAWSEAPGSHGERP